MNFYGAKEMAASFRTVRKNTLIIADEIPEDKYDFRPAEGSRTVGEILTHIALGGRLQERVQLEEKRTSMAGFDFMQFRAGVMAEAAGARSKAETVALLKKEGERWAGALEALT